MAVYALGDVVPTIDGDAYVHPDATVIGDVSLGPDATVWPHAVLRGDYGSIVVGARTSIQDGTVIHAGPQFPTIVGDGCVVGHLVHLEGCTLEDECLVGSGAVVLHHALVGTGATVGAGAVVPRLMQVPPGGPGRGDTRHGEARSLAAPRHQGRRRRVRDQRTPVPGRAPETDLKPSTSPCS